jgi:hypothetical protein
MAGIARQSQERANAAAASAFDKSSAVRSGVSAGLGYAATPFVDSKLKKPQTPQPTFSGVTNSTGG